MGALPWWQKPIRMLRLDYRPDELAALKKTDMVKLAERRYAAWHHNCEWLMGSMGLEGRAYQMTFHADGYQVHPAFHDFDLLRSYVEPAKQVGIHVVSYLNMHWFAYAFGRDVHADWQQVHESGEPYGNVLPLYGNGTTFCVNSPFRQWAAGVVRRAMETGIEGIFLDGPVVFDGCCYCKFCQEQFRAHSGKPIPRENWKDPLWHQFQIFREQSLASFLSEMRIAARQVDPDAVVFLNAGGWHPGAWRMARDIQRVRMHQDLNGAEAFFHYGADEPVNASMLMAKYQRAPGQPAIVFTHHMDSVWHDLLLPPMEVRRALFQTVAGGANPWLACNHQAAEQDDVGRKAAADVYAFLEKHETYFQQLISTAQVAVLCSSRTAQRFLAHFENFYRKPGAAKEQDLTADLGGKTVAEGHERKRICEKFLDMSLTGYLEALTRGHILFDALLDYQVTTEHLARYNVLVLPDAAYLSDEQVHAITSFVKAGGKVLASFEAGLLGGDSSTTLAEVLGVEGIDGMFAVMTGDNYSRVLENYLGFEKNHLLERAAYALRVRSAVGSNVPARFLEPVTQFYGPVSPLSSCPAIVRTRYGQGRSIYFPEAIGHFFGSLKVPHAEDRICAAVRDLLGENEFEVQAPHTVSVACYTQPTSDRILIHMVNNTGDGAPNRAIIPVGPVSIRLKSHSRSGRAYGLRERQVITVEKEERGLCVTVPRLTEYEVVVVE